MPRLFVAVDLPPDVKAGLAALGQGLPGVRWLAPDHLHLTLRFIGEVEDTVAAAIREGLHGVGGAPFDCRLHGVGAFPPRGRPRVLWAAVQAEAGLPRVQAALEEALRRLGLAPEDRKFVPHITLARLKDIPPAQIRQYLAVHERFQSRSFPVQAFHLYSSCLTRQGAIHTLEQSYPFEK